LAHHVATSKAALILLVSLIPVMMLLRGIVNYLNTYLMSWVSVRTICDLRARIFAHLQAQPLSFHSRMSTGELMARVNDAGVLQNMIAVSMVTLIREPVTAITLFIGVVAIDWKLTLAALAVLALCGIPISIYNKKVRHAGAANQTEAAALNRVLHEAFSGNRIVKAYNLEPVMIGRYNQTLQRFISHAMRVVRATETPGPIIEFAGALGVAFLLVYLAGTKSPEASAAFILGLIAMYKPIKASIRVQSQVHQAKAATERLFELLASPNGMPDSPNPLPLKAAGAEIQFDNISFAYDQKHVLRDFNLTVKPGQMVALVGGTGGGKTTVTNLLLRFYDPATGAVRIGGTDIRQVTLRDLRSQIADNIAYGRPGAARAEIEEAARHAFAHDFILEKPRGYDSPVGERATNLSGGQKQRIAIARAIIRNAPILILDEATSSLDNESERIVQAALDELMKGRTTICIAHRLSTVRHADVIVVIDRGQIAEQGSHDELLQRGGIYHKLYKYGIATGSDELPTA
jgi:subfamily B ATP-binding cassette protein MsbA